MTPHFSSALFPGHVMHARFKPKAHRLAYRIYSLLLDLDELDALDRKLRLFSVDRFNLFSFHRRDRGDGSKMELRNQIENAMTAAGMTVDGGPIRLLTMPRILGWAFNPLSVFSATAGTGLSKPFSGKSTTRSASGTPTLSRWRPRVRPRSSSAATRPSMSRPSWTWISVMYSESSHPTTS